jgi:hypothetical protein
MTGRSSLARRAGVLLPVALAVAAAALLVGGPSGPDAGVAGDRYRAGEAATERTVLAGDDAARARTRGLTHARALGLPVGTATEAARVEDRFAGTVLDEVVTTDARGRRLGIVRTDAAGRLASAVRLGWRAATGARVEAAGAVSRASALAAAAGLPRGGTPAATPLADGGWRVTWGRVADGIPVRGDGTGVTLFADGSFHAAARQERALAPAPAVPLTRAVAEQIAGERLGDILGAERGNARLVGARLAWVAPNGAFDASAPDAPDPVLRLAWVVEARTSGTLSERLQALELYLDADDGALIGGDLLR